MRKRISRGLLLAILAIGPLVVLPALAGDRPIRKNANAIKNEYIVVLRDDVPSAKVPELAQSLAREHKGKVRRTWQHTIRGFHAEMTEARAAALARHPDVAYVEENAGLSLSTSTPTKIDPATCDANGQNCTTTTDNRLWNLDRLSQTWATPDETATWCSDGSEVTVYVVDSGVMGQHQEFLRANGTSRVETGYDATQDYKAGGVEYFPANNPCNGWAGDRPPSGTYQDLETDNYNREVGNLGHGTSAASVVGGRVTGVARNVTIVPVKVSPCEWEASRWARRSQSYAVGTAAFAAKTFSNGTHGITHQLVCKVAGTTAATEPAWPSPYQVGDTVQDGTVTWEIRRLTPEFRSGIADLIEGVDWIMRQTDYPKTKAVVTMSTYKMADVTGVDESPDGILPSLEQVIRNVVEPASGPGIPLVASANNQGEDACDMSPGRMSRSNPTTSLQSKVITVGGSQLTNVPGHPDYDPEQPTLDARWVCDSDDASLCNNVDTTAGQRGSNGGQCVTLFAPAKNISVASTVGPATYRNVLTPTVVGASGTSWSAPFVAGVIARHLQQDPSLTVDDVYDTLMDNALYGVMRDDTAYPLDPSTVAHPGEPSVVVTDTPNVLVNAADVSIAPAGQPTDQVASASAPASLTVTATGIGTLTYQWYKVDTGFDLTHRTGASSSQLINGATSATLGNLNPSATTGYWVRVKSGCAQVESNIATVTPVPATPPSNVVATASGTTVTIIWNAVANATGYDVERKVGSSAWTLAAQVTTTTANDTPTAPAGVVLYRVFATFGTARSYASDPDVAYVLPFTDATILTASPFTVVKAEHIVELRKAVNALRELGGQSAVYTGLDLDAPTVRTLVVEDTQWTTLMSNLSTARTDLGLPGWGFTSPPGNGVLIDNAHIEELRNGVR